MRLLIVFLMCSFLSVAAFAEALIDLGGTYSADSLTTSSDAANTQYFYNLGVLFNLDRRMQWTMGWVLFGISQNTTNDTTEVTYSSMDMGPALRWNIDKNGVFSLTAAYGYLSRGTYNGGGDEEHWEGSSLFGQFSVQAPIREEKLYIGLSLNYYAANYTKKIVNTVESTNDTQKSWIFPMISLTWRP